MTFPVRFNDCDFVSQNMAIDLASNLSCFEFQNMLPLDVLAAVASEKLRDEIHSPDTPKIKTSSIVKKHVKKSSTNVLTFEDIKCMPTKLLIDKFSEMTSDELTKKYSYRCILLPQTCSTTFKSFGNEKKACDEMKSHLLLHVRQLTMEYESNKGITDVVFIPKSPNSNSKCAEKLSKKYLKKQQTSPNSVLPRTYSPKTSKKTKTSPFSVKTSKKKLNENKKYASELKNDYYKTKVENDSSVYLNDGPSLKQFYDNCFLPCDNYLPAKRAKNEILEELDQGCDSEHYSSYSRHLKIAFFTDVEVKEEISESLSGSEQVSDLNDSNSSHEAIRSTPSPTITTNSDKSIAFLQDHNYVCLDDTKSDKMLSSEFKNMPRKYEDPFLHLTRNEPPPYVIKTPPFPFIHTPLLPEVAEILEIRLMDMSSVYEIDSYPHYVNYLGGTSSPKSDAGEVPSDEFSSDHEDKYSEAVFYKFNNPSTSVLECVENIENKKHSSSCVPKNEISASENDENLENLQKDEKELALKYIAKLHSKGKKKISDSLICQICPDKHFTAQATLIHHYRSHAGIKPYICKLCSSKFTRQHSLNYHMLIHQNLSRFTCNFCGRTFRHPSHYKEHLRRHTGETPYHCTDCNLHFKTRNTFKRHLKTRHGKLLTAGGIEDLNAE